MSRRLLALAVLAFALAGPVTSASPAPTVTVRVEGQDQTLLPATTVTLGSTPVVLRDATCPANSAAAALDLATGGNWDRSQFTSTILGETHTFANRDYWAEWVSNRFGGGLCTDLLNEGDELLMIVDTSDATFNPTVFPLVMSGVPATDAPGTPFTVTVTQFRTNGTPGTSTTRSLSAIGTPPPLSSSIGVMMALSCGFSASARSRAHSTSSLALTSPVSTSSRWASPSRRPTAKASLTDGPFPLASRCGLRR